MHTGQVRVVDSHGTRFLATSVQNHWFALRCTVALSLLQGCGGGSSASSSATPLTITATSLPGGTTGVSYSATLTAAGGTGAGYGWTVSAGALPGGLTLAGGGTVASTPAAAGTFSFAVQFTDSSGAAATANLSVVIAAAGPLTNYEFTGNTSPVHDPSIIRQGSTHYMFSNDASSTQGGWKLERLPYQFEAAGRKKTITDEGLSSARHLDARGFTETLYDA
jgi:Putative Ig domain